MKMKKTVFIALSLLLVAGTLSAQGWKGKGRVNGVVTDEAGNPLEGVNVKFFNVEEKGGFEVKTDQDGKFTGAWLRKGTWNLDFFKVGYEMKPIQIEINELSRNPDIAMVLKKAEGLMLTDELRKDLEAANALFDKGEYQEAIAAFEAMLAKNPDVYILYQNIGNCYFSLEQYDKAEEAYQKILEKEPDNIEATIGVGNTYANRGDNDKAMEWYNKIDMMKINDSTVLYNIGLKYSEAGQGEIAVKYFKQALVVNPKDLDSLYRLGLQYTSNNNKAEAIATFEDFLKAAPPEEPRIDQVKKFLEYLRR